MNQKEKNIINENIELRLETQKEIKSLNKEIRLLSNELQNKKTDLIRISKENIEITEKSIELLQNYLLADDLSSFKKMLELLFNNNYSNSFYDRLFNLDPSDKKSIINKISNWFKNFSVEGLQVISLDLEKYLMK